MIGMEVRREMAMGRIDRPQAVLIAVMGGIGGMIFPALIYLAIAPVPATSTAGAW